MDLSILSINHDVIINYMMHKDDNIINDIMNDVDKFVNLHRHLIDDGLYVFYLTL
jgi:hypothetical protein